MENFRAKKQASLDRLLLRDIKSTKRQKTSAIDDKETKLLLDERAAYVDYLSRSLAGLIPSEVSNLEVFKQRAQEKIRRVVKKKNKGDAPGEERKDSEIDEDNENIFFSEEEEDDDVKF